MNACTHFREALLDRADGRPLADAAALEAHLSGCRACFTLAERMGPPLNLGRVEVPAVQLSELRADLHRRLDELEPAPGVFAWLFAGSFSIPKPLAWAAAVVVLTLWTARLPAHVPPPPPAPRTAPVLMDAIDRLALGGEAVQG